MSGGRDQREAFARALVGKMLDAQGLDPQGADVLAQAAGAGRSDEQLRWQRPTRYYPGLTAKPWHEPSEFSGTQLLRDASAKIREEALALRQAGRFAVDAKSAHLAEGPWNEYRFYTEGVPCRENLDACPVTADVLARIPGATSAGLAYFSAVGPGARVRPHCGPHNARLRCQLGLVMPDGCELRVAGQARRWNPGAVVVFDDSFEHELLNPGDETRIVLIVDVWHPDLTPSQIIAIRYGEASVIDLAYEVARDWVRSGAIGATAAPRDAERVR